MRGINIDYISHAIDELIELLGIKEDVPFGNLYNKFTHGNVKGCIEDIAKYLGLPISVNLSYVSRKHQSRNPENRFASASLSQTNEAGRGSVGITAQVDIPPNLPYYGSPALERFPISVKVSDDLKDDPSAFIPIMAHELSHILLHSLRFKEKDNEYYTDLTAMILGFSEVMLDARDLFADVEIKQQGNNLIMNTQKVKYGYIPDELFDFAYNKIRDNLLKQRHPKLLLVRTLDSCTNNIRNYRVELTKFQKFLEYLDKKQGKKINKEDSQKIVSFHGVGYADKFKENLAGYERRIQKAREFSKGFTHYTKQNLDLLRQQVEETNILLSDIIRDCDLLKEDIGIMEKYIGFLYKYKANRKARS